MLFVNYPKCSTCKKAKKWLKENGFEFEDRDIKLNNPTKEEVKKWYEISSYDINKFFNSSGVLYRELSLKDKLKHMSLDEKFQLLASDGMLVKRPILVTDKDVILGFKEEIWKERLG